MSQVTRVWRIDPETGIVLYHEDLQHSADGSVHVPGNCVLVEAPEVTEKQLRKWVSSVPRTNYLFGTEGTGAYEILADYRKAKLYFTFDGQEYTIGAELDVDGQQESYDGVGYLPDWLTVEPRPSTFHNWSETGWEPDDAAIEKNKKNMERAWRDHEISRISWLRDRHRDELEQDLETSLTDAQYVELQEYIQQLRDWPAQAAFPNQEMRPDIPYWLSVT